MDKCGARLGLAFCDRPAGHTGKHMDYWILPETMEFEDAEITLPIVDH